MRIADSAVITPLGVTLRLGVTVEHCTAERPSATLKGSKEAYESAAKRLQVSLTALALRLEFDLHAFRINPRSDESRADGSTLWSRSHRRPPPLPAQLATPAYPRVGAFEVSYRITDDTGLSLIHI